MLRSMRTQKRTIGFTKKPSSRTFAESSMLKRRGLLGTRSPRTHKEASLVLSMSLPQEHNNKHTPAKQPCF